MFPNALAWGHFQLRGGWRNAFTIATVYAFLSIGGYVLISIFAAAGGFQPGVLLTILTGIQTASLVFFGSARVGAAVRLDVTSRLIESHRLMPTSPFEAIAGYLIGGGAAPLMVFTTGFLVGLGFSITGDLPVDRWVLSNAILLVFGLFIWTLAVMSSFGTKGSKKNAGIGWLIGFASIGFTGGGTMLMFLPTLLILCSPILGDSVFVAKGGRAAASETYAVSLLGQLSVGAILFYGAMRRYSSDEKRGFTPLTSLLLVFIWIAIAVYGIRYWDLVAPRFMRSMFHNLGKTELTSIQLVCSLAGGLLLSLLPLGVALREDRERAIRKAAGGTTAGHTIPYFGMVTLLTFLLLALAILTRTKGTRLGDDFLLFKMGLTSHRAALVITAGVVVSFIVSCGQILRITGRRGGSNGGWMLFLFLLLEVAAPPAIDAIRAVNTVNVHDNPMTRLAGVSPVVALVESWTNGASDPAPGVIVQLAGAGFLTLLPFVFGRKSPSTTALKAA